ncbi:hypothetical protein ACQJBY_045406 [Aegilops geniculata]
MMMIGTIRLHLCFLLLLFMLSLVFICIIMLLDWRLSFFSSSCEKRKSETMPFHGIHSCCLPPCMSIKLNKNVTVCTCLLNLHQSAPNLAPGSYCLSKSVIHMLINK